MHVGDDEEMQKRVKILKIKEQENDGHEGKTLVEVCNLIPERLESHCEDIHSI